MKKRIVASLLSFALLASNASAISINDFTDLKDGKTKERTKGVQTFMFDALEKLPLEEVSSQRVREVYTRDNDFLIYFKTDKVDMFSLETGSSNYKIYYVILDNKEVIPSDAYYSYGNRGAFASKTPLDNRRIDYVIMSDGKTPKLFIQKVNISLGQQKVVETDNWDYRNDDIKVVDKILNKDSNRNSERERGRR